jgi:hypothetical protein
LGSKRLSVWLLIFAICFAVLHILPPFMAMEISHRFEVGDVVDILTPFVLIFILVRIYLEVRREAEGGSPVVAIVFLVLGGVAFVEGHGMHLSANAIARHLGNMAHADLLALDYFFDEVLGHILWDGGFILISLGFILLAGFYGDRAGVYSKPILALIGSVFYGFTYFVNAVEGQTVLFTLPISVLIQMWILWVLKRRGIGLLGHPVLVFYLFGYLVGLCFFAVWGIWRGGYPQFSELGWI